MMTAAAKLSREGRWWGDRDDDDGEEEVVVVEVDDNDKIDSVDKILGQNPNNPSLTMAGRAAVACDVAAAAGNEGGGGGGVRRRRVALVTSTSRGRV